MNGTDTEDLQDDSPAARLPGAQAEFDAFAQARLWPLIDKSQSEDAEGETVRVTLTIPREWMTLAAWLQIKSRLRQAGKLEPWGGAVDLDPRMAHWDYAKTYLWKLIHEHFHEELHELSVGAHPYLYPPPQEPPRRQTADLDDDVPF